MLEDRVLNESSSDDTQKNEAIETVVTAGEITAALGENAPSPLQALLAEARRADYAAQPVETRRP